MPDILPSIAAVLHYYSAGRTLFFQLTNCLEALSA